MTLRFKNSNLSFVLPSLGMAVLHVSTVNYLAIFFICYYYSICLLLICKGCLYILDVNLCQFWTSSVPHLIAFKIFVISCVRHFTFWYTGLSIFSFTVCTFYVRERKRDRQTERQSYALIKDKSIPDRQKSQRISPEAIKMFEVLEKQSAREPVGLEFSDQRQVVGNE